MLKNKFYQKQIPIEFDRDKKYMTQFNAQTLIDFYREVFVINRGWVIDSDKLLLSHRGHR